MARPSKVHISAKWLVAAALCLTQASLCAAEVAVERLQRLAPVGRLQETIEKFAGFGSRVAGYPGAKKAAPMLPPPSLP